MTYILAIDQGTTSTRAILFDDSMTAVARGQEEFAQHFPQPGWVEHDAKDLWRTTVKDCGADFGHTHADLFDHEIPICGVDGDQQAATVGQACFQPGMMKSTYGTGCFALLNTGETPVVSQNRLLTTIAYQLNGKPTYALEGSIFVAGAVVQWLRGGLQIINDASETQALAEQVDPIQNVVLVPAFVGLGAPYWNAECRGAVFGLTRGSGPAEMAKAALESVGYQTRDLLEAMSADWQTTGVQPTLRVDGGMSNSDWAMQFLSDIIAALWLRI